MSIFESIVSRQEIHKGWSGDRKFRAVTNSGDVYFLRLSSPDRYERRRGEFQRMQEAAALGIRMCDPIEFGVCEEGVYAILRWIDGEDAETVLSRMTREQQYAAGLEAGRILRKLHTIPAPDDLEPWSVRYGRKLDKKSSVYKNGPLKYENGDYYLDFIAQNRHLLEGRPQCWQHGDYHCGNLMFGPDGHLVVIDFDRDDFGDPWHEFNRIIWDARCAPRYACGLLDGYFDGSIPEEFWPVLALYLAQNMVGSLSWALALTEQDVQTALENGARVLLWYDNMTRTVPNWYHE